MPIVNGPYRDPDEDHPPRRRKPPKPFARLKQSFRDERKLAAFEEVFDGKPVSDDELDAFFEEDVRELYNSGWGKIE